VDILEEVKAWVGVWAWGVDEEDGLKRVMK